MKTNLRRMLATIFAMVLLFTIVGCGSNEGSSNETNSGVNDDFFGIDENTIDSNVNSSNSQSNSTTSGTTTNTNKTGGKTWKEVLESMPKKLRGSTLKVYNWNPTSEYQGATSVIEKFEKQTGITVKWQTVNFDQYQTTVAAAIASGDSPDLVRTRTTNPVPLQNLQPISVSGYDFNDEAWDKVALKHYSYNGKSYAATLKNTHLGTVNILMYNSSLIDQYDLEDPYQLWKNGSWTWNKFIDVCKKYKKASKAQYAVASHNWESWFNIHGISAPVALKNGKFVNISCTSEFVNIAQKISDFSLRDKLFSTEAEIKNLFDKGGILFFGDASIFARSKNAYFGSLKESGTLYAVPYPKIEGQSKYYVGSGEYEAYGIAKGAKNPTAAPYFLRYFLDAENYDMSSFYGNAKVLEVYNWSMQQERIASVSFNASPDYGETYDQNYYTKLTKTQSSQMKSYLESYSNIVDSRVKELNRAVANLK